MRDFSNYKPIDLERPQSNCCGVDVDPDYLICPHCKEHCGIEQTVKSYDKGSCSSDDQIEKIIQHHIGNPLTMRIDLEILRHLVKREQMIEDHKLYMGAIKEE